MFRRHFEEMSKEFNGGQVFAFNLVTTHNSNEKKLKDMHESLVKEANLPEKQLAYYHFDFHHECAKNTDPLVTLVEGVG